MKEAQYNLGVFYAQGRGVRRDDRLAAHYYKLAADQGDAAAQADLGHLYSDGRGGLPKNERDAVRLYRLAADQGNTGAQAKLGWMYDNGLGGLPKDKREAARLYKLAADQGNAGAQFNLGVNYYYGLGGLPRDRSEARRLYKLAADQGNADAQAALKEKPRIFTRLFGGGAETTDDGPHRLGEQERQRKAAEEERERRWRENQEREREAAAREQQRRWQEERDREREADERERQRRRHEDDRQRDAAFGNISAAQALEILGLAEGANAEQVQAAYQRLMKRVHPDVGGSNYFAKQLNAARDALLKQRQG